MKRKLVALLMCVMMAVAYMPSMAFAETIPTEDPGISNDQVAGETFAKGETGDVDDEGYPSDELDPGTAIGFTIDSELTGINLTEGVDGESRDDDNGDTYWHYTFDASKVFRDGDAITITWERADGTIVEVHYVYEEDGEGFAPVSGHEAFKDYYDYVWNDDFYSISDQEGKWEPGSDKTMKIAFNDVECEQEINVHICEQNIENIKLVLASGETNVVLREGIDGEYSTTYDENDEEIEYFSYAYGLAHILHQGDSLRVTYKDGESAEFIYDPSEEMFVSESNGNIELSEIDDANIEDKVREPGDTDTFTYYYHTVEIDVPIRIVENPIDSISYERTTPMKLVEGIDTFAEDDEVFYNIQKENIFCQGDTLTINYRDETKVEYVFDSRGVERTGFFNVNDSDDFIEPSNIDLLTTSDRTTTWETSNTYLIEMRYLGIKFGLDVEVTENSISSIEYETYDGQPWQIIENLEGDEGPEYFQYSDVFSAYVQVGDKLTINYKDGTSREFTYTDEYLFESDGECISEDEVEIDTGQEGPWEVGSEHEFTLTYESFSCNVQATIVANPVSKIEYTPAAPIQLVAEKHGFFDNDEEGNEYFHYHVEAESGIDLYKEDSILKVTYTNGDVVEYTCDDNGIFKSSDPTNYQDIDEIFANEIEGHEQETEHWTVGNKYNILVWYMGKTCVLPVSIVEFICEHTTLTHHEKVDPTCTDDGVAEFWVCDSCSQHFADADAQTPIDEDDTIIEKLGHDFGAAEYSWTEDNSSVTASRICSRCPEEETETASTTSKVTKEATCIAKGETTYTAAFENSAFETQTKTVDNIDIDLENHDWGEWAVTPATTEAEGTKTHICTRCETTEKVTIPKLDPTVTLSTSSYTWNGKAKTPGVTVKNNGVLMTKGTDYDVTYAAGRIKPGKYKVTVTFKGDYSGETFTTLTIKKAANTLSVKPKTGTVKYKALKKKNQTLAVTKVLTVTKNKGKVTYKKLSGNSKITVSSSGKVTVKKKLKKGTHKIKVRVTAAGTTYYNKATKNVYFKVKVK